MAKAAVNPLTWNVMLIDPKTGFPTPEFQRKWQQQAGVNSSVPSLSVAAQTVMANLGAATSNATGEKLSAVIEALIGDTIGGLLIRTGSGWVVLPPGTAGQKLTMTAGVPAWV